jgi:hypothetical protein
MIRKTRNTESHGPVNAGLRSISRQTKAARQAGGFGASLKLLEKRRLDRFLSIPTLEGGFDAFEKGDQGIADLTDDQDNGDANAGGDQTIFNGGYTGLVIEKTIELRHDFTTPC